jgi:hypothetical protein
MQIVYLLVIILILFWILSYGNNSISLLKKILISFFLLTLISVVVWFDSKIISDGKHKQDILKLYINNKNIQCNGTIVNKKEFDYIGLNNSFLSKKSTSLMKLDINKCTPLDQ